MTENINPYNEIAKFDRLLRLFNCYKHLDDSDAAQIRNQCQKILDKLKLHCPETYEEHFPYLQQKIKKALSKEIKQSKPKPKPKEISQILNKPSQSSSSSGFIQYNEEMKKSSSKDISSIRFGQGSSQKMKSFESSNNIFLSSKSPQSSQSLNASIQEQSQLKIGDYFQKFNEGFQFKLAFNDDLYESFLQNVDSIAYLLGVQKPDLSKAQKLYLSAIMKFPFEEVKNLTHLKSNNPYADEIKEFENAGRIPLALVVKGAKITDMKMQYVKFLLQFSSPFPIVFIVNPENLQKSFLIKMDDKAIRKIEKSQIFDLDKLNEELIKDTRNYKDFPLNTIEKSNSKNFLTKYLKLEIKKIQNEKAIQVNDTSYIKQEKVLFTKPTEFNYKLHHKFLNGKITEDYFFYSINEDKQLYQRTKIQSLQQAKDQIKDVNHEIILGFKVKSDKKKIAFDMFIDAWNCQDISPMFILKYQAITGGNKASFVCFKEGVTEEMIKSTELTLIEIDKNTNPLFQRIITIDKNNAETYETKNPVKTFS